MAVISNSLKLVYFDITKAGSSSVKRALWEYEHGRPFPGRGLGRVVNAVRGRLARVKLVKPRNIHEIPGYRTESFKVAKAPDGFETFTLVRDPASRIMSAWKDKIHFNQFRWRGEIEDLKAEGLPVNPTFGEFIDNFDCYRLTSRPARVHTTPYCWHLGGNIDFFDHVFMIEEFGRLTAFLDEKAGRPFRVPRRNQSTSDMRDASLTPRQVEKLFEIIESDYRLLGDLYDINASAARFAGQRKLVASSR